MLTAKQAFELYEDPADIERVVAKISRAPANRPSREETLSEILDLTDHVTSVALFGSIGVGKSFVARVVLDNDRTKARFGENRYPIRCHLITSLGDFLTRLSDAIKTDVELLQSRLLSTSPLILVLDDVGLMLDPLNPGSQEISSTIEQFGGYENVCLVTTSRAPPDIRGFHKIEVPTLSEEAARDIFYRQCGLGRSSAVDYLITTLGSHPLSVELLANCVRENHWDESKLLKEWEDDQTGLVRASYNRRLRDIVEPALCSPTIQRLGNAARDVLEEIAASPRGIEERELEKELDGIGQVIDALCKSSLTYRRDGVVDILFPVRSYLLEFAFIPAQTEEVIPWGDDCMPSRACKQFSYRKIYIWCNTSRSSPHIHQWTPSPCYGAAPRSSPEEEVGPVIPT